MKISLPDDVARQLQQEADSLGLTPAGFVRMLVVSRYRSAALHNVPGARIQAARAEELQQEALSSVTGEVSGSVLDAQVSVEEDLRAICVDADRTGDRKKKVAALIQVYNGWWPAEGKYQFTRLTEQRAKEWLRKGGESATGVYDFLLDRVVGKELDNPATYSSKVLDGYGQEAPERRNGQQQEPPPLDVFNHALVAGGMGELTLDDITAFAETQKKRGRPGKGVNGQ